MKLLLMSILMVHQCGGMNEGNEVDAGGDAEVDEHGEYPSGPYGFKAAVRRVDGVLQLGMGDVLPSHVSSRHDGTLVDGTLVDGDDVWDDVWETDFWVLVISTVDCPACDQLMLHIDDVALIVGGNPLVTETKTPPEEFEGDRWPEVIRGYPTTFIIDLETMEIAVEQLGFSDVPAFWDSISEKLDFYHSNK